MSIVRGLHSGKEPLPPRQPSDIHTIGYPLRNAADRVRGIVQELMREQMETAKSIKK
jgi:hypothetical protein